MNRRFSTRAQEGFTLIELLVVMMIGTVLVSILSTVIISTMRTTKRTHEHLVSSSGAFRTSNRFSDDVGTAGTGRTLANPAGVTLFPIARSSPGCGNESASVVMTGPSSTGVTMISYHQVDNTLVRRSCQGATDAEAIASATFAARRVVDDLAPSGVAVTCRASSTSPVNPPPPDPSSNDEQCRIVTIAIKTTTCYSFTVEGARSGTDTPGQAVPDPPVKKQCTLVPSADATVSSLTGDRDTNWANADYTGQPELATFQGAGRERRKFFFVKFDLGSPCLGENEPPALEVGVDIISAEFSLFFDAYSDAPGDLKEHQMIVMGDSARWGETNLTFNSNPWRNPPGDVVGDPANNEKFYALNTFWQGAHSTPQRSFTIHRADRPSGAPAPAPENCYADYVRCRITPIDVTEEVTQWYANAVDSTTGWHNNGWMIKRQHKLANHVYDDQSRGFRFGSREATHEKRPHLVIEWA